MRLIIPGNPNLATIASVLVIAQRHYQKPIEKVLFLDVTGLTTGPEHQGGKECLERSELVHRHVPGPVEVSEIRISATRLAEVVPEVIAREVQQAGREEVIADFTNGTKLISGILYSVATLLRIGLFYVSVARDKQSRPPEDLTQDDYQVSAIQPLSDPGSLGRFAYFDMTYYKDAFHNALDRVTALGLKMTLTPTQVTQTVASAVDDYFAGKYDRCVSAVGGVAEDLSRATCLLINRRAQRSVVAIPANADFAATTTRLRTDFCEPLRAKKGTGLSDVEEPLYPLYCLDSVLETLRIYRNEASHPRPRQIPRHEAKHCLDALLTCLLAASEISS